MNDAVRTQIENLRNEKTKALKARYRELFGEDSHSSNHAHLFRRIAWRYSGPAGLGAEYVASVGCPRFPGMSHSEPGKVASGSRSGTPGWIGIAAAHPPRSRRLAF